MRFISWLKLQVNRPDPIGNFARWAVKNKKFPLSSDPLILKVYLFDDLKGGLYGDFQMAFIEYSFSDKHQIPKEYSSLEALKKAIL